MFQVRTYLLLSKEKSWGGFVKLQITLRRNSVTTNSISYKITSISHSKVVILFNQKMKSILFSISNNILDFFIV